MAGKRRPMDVNLSVVEGGKGKHWTKAEVEARQNSEPKLPKPKVLKPPSWLSDPAKKLFKSYAKQMKSRQCVSLRRGCILTGILTHRFY